MTLVGAWLAGPQASIGQGLAALSGQTWTLASLLGGAIALIFLGWLVPYRLVRRKDYERVMDLLDAAQRTNAQNSESLKAIAENKDLATAVVAALRAEGSTITTHRGAVHEEQP